jgi:exodeoxyribonuclease V beta subunit
MENKFYYLQLSIYTVALHRFLGARMPGYDYETHFGGVFYLFLRGIDPARPESGIWRTRPAADFIERLSRTFDHDS